MSDSAQEKNLPATEKRKREAREKGQLPRSRELSTAVVMGVGASLIMSQGGSVGSKASDLMSRSLSFDAAMLADPSQMPKILLSSFGAGLAIVAPDTSPRGEGVPNDDAYDLGQGAGFYLDAPQDPWKANFRMGSYVNEELPALIEANFPVIAGRRGIFGHSMGGHGALVTALRNPTRWHSVSAFAPISNPVAVPWGQKAFGNYLGADQSTWEQYDASLLIRSKPYPGLLLVDQGLADNFLNRELKPENLDSAARASGQRLSLRLHADYDHSYWFIQSFIADHLAHHASQLGL